MKVGRKGGRKKGKWKKLSEEVKKIIEEERERNKCKRWEEREERDGEGDGDNDLWRIDNEHRCALCTS